MLKSTCFASGIRNAVQALLLVTLFFPGTSAAQNPREPKQPDRPAGRKLSHEETLRLIADHRAWRLARKTKPILARPVAAEEVGKEFQTADHVKEVAREGVWLCVGVAGEPWFQSLEKIQGKYELSGEETKQFEFDKKASRYWRYQPKETTLNWVAQVKDPDVEGFTIRPGYDPTRPLYSPVGGYVVRADVADPYNAPPDDVWLVQQSLFESTYELVVDRAKTTAPPAPGKALPSGATAQY
jgi:hypothetical protein